MTIGNPPPKLPLGTAIDRLDVKIEAMRGHDRYTKAQVIGLLRMCEQVCNAYHDETQKKVTE